MVLVWAGLLLRNCSPSSITAPVALKVCSPSMMASAPRPPSWAIPAFGPLMLSCLSKDEVFLVSACADFHVLASGGIGQCRERWPCRRPTIQSEVLISCAEEAVLAVVQAQGQVMMAVQFHPRR